MSVYCEYCGQQMTSAPSHIDHIEDDCKLRPDRLLMEARLTLLSIIDAGSIGRARKIASDMIPRIERCLKRAPWKDQYKP